MVRVRLAEPRATIVEEPGGLRIIIPVERNWFVILYLGVFLVFFLVFVAIVLFNLSASPPKHGGFPLFLIILIVLGISMSYPFAWNAWGQEVAYITPGSLVVRREIFGIGRSQEFDLAHVREMRARQPYVPVWWRMYPLGKPPGSISFDYGAKTYSFGEGLDEAEAKGIVESVGKRFPTIA